MCACREPMLGIRARHCPQHSKSRMRSMFWEFKCQSGGPAVHRFMGIAVLVREGTESFHVRIMGSTRSSRFLGREKGGTVRQACEQ